MQTFQTWPNKIYPNLNKICLCSPWHLCVCVCLCTNDSFIFDTDILYLPQVPPSVRLQMLPELTKQTRNQASFCVCFLKAYSVQWAANGCSRVLKRVSEAEGHIITELLCFRDYMWSYHWNALQTAKRIWENQDGWRPQNLADSSRGNQIRRYLFLTKHYLQGQEWTFTLNRAATISRFID